MKRHGAGAGGSRQEDSEVDRTLCESGVCAPARETLCCATLSERGVTRVRVYNTRTGCTSTITMYECLVPPRTVYSCSGAALHEMEANEPFVLLGTGVVEVSTRTVLQ